MTEKEFERQKRILARRNEEYQMKKELRKLRWSWLPKFKKPTTSKLILVIVFLLNLQIIYFVEKVIEEYGDLSALYALIAIPATLIPTVWAYYAKSKAQNVAGGITYDIAMEELRQKNANQHNEDYTESVG